MTFIPQLTTVTKTAGPALTPHGALGPPTSDPHRSTKALVGGC
jgi:hypothetical protein